jgi:hypothetical protein
VRCIFAARAEPFGGKELCVDPESENLENERNRLGRKSQVGGGLATFLGVLLFLATPAAPPGAPVNVHQMAALFIVIGIFGFADGTLARWYYLD